MPNTLYDAWSLKEKYALLFTPFCGLAQRLKIVESLIEMFMSKLAKLGPFLIRFFRYMFALKQDFQTGFKNWDLQKLRFQKMIFSNIMR